MLNQVSFILFLYPSCTRQHIQILLYLTLVSLQEELHQREYETVSVSRCIFLHVSAEAIRREYVVPLAESLAPLQYAGHIRWIFLKEHRSRIKNPLSAMTASPSSSKSIRPVFFTISLSEIRPVHSGGTNEITPVGVIPISNFAVFQCL